MITYANGVIKFSRFALHTTYIASDDDNNHTHHDRTLQCSTIPMQRIHRNTNDCSTQNSRQHECSSDISAVVRAVSTWFQELIQQCHDRVEQSKTDSKHKQKNIKITISKKCTPLFENTRSIDFHNTVRRRRRWTISKEYVYPKQGQHRESELPSKK